MDQNEHQTLQSLTQFLTPQLLKKIIHLLFSLSVFSILFSFSSCYSFFLHALKFYFFTTPFQLLSHIMDKSCIFFIFNGILVFLARTSGFAHSSPVSDLNDLPLIKKIGESLQMSSDMKECLMLEKEVLVETVRPQEDRVMKEEEEEQKEKEEEEEEEKRYKYSSVSSESENPNSNLKDKEEDEEQEAGSGVMSTVGEKENGKGVAEDEDKGKESESSFLIEEEEEEENGCVSLSNEELNKKCDDFIRRMKEEIRFQAQRQLVVF